MAIDQESFNTDLYKLLRTRGYKPVPKDAKNQRIQPEAAEVFHFTFNKDGKDYGDAWVTIDDAQKVILYYGNEQEDSPSGKSPGLDYDDSWSGLKRHLKQWSMNKQLTFELRNKDELGDDMAQRDYVKKKEKMNEGYHSMGNKASYNDNIPAVKIILQHNRKIEEGEQRYRNIAKIFLENQEGERFLAPTTRPGIAQVYARHIAEGGVPNDERWNHVKALCEEYSKMAGFVRATKNKQFMESAQQLVSEGVNHYQSLRETLGKLRGHRGYNMYFESWTPALMEDDTDSTINELFVQETVDPRIESVMPILARLNKNKATTTVKEVSELAEWADSITEMDDGIPDNLSPSERKEQKERDKKEYDKNLKKTPDSIKKKLNLPDKLDEQGLAEGSCEVEEDLDSSPVESAIIRRIINVRTELLGKHGPEKVLDAVKEVASYVGDVDEIGSSDVSGWIRQVERILSSQEVEEDLDPQQKKAGQLGPTEKVGKEGAVGKLGGANEAVAHDSPEESVIMDIVNGNIDAYDVMNYPKTEAEQEVSGILQDMYERISIDSRLHPDDDFEEIIEIMMDELSSEYDPYPMSESMDEGYRPGEINNGDQVTFKKDSPYYEPGVFTVSKCDDKKCWLQGENNAGWFHNFRNELELADSLGFDDDDDFDPDFVYGKSEPEYDVDSNDFGDFGDDPRDTDPLDEIKRLLK
jgi:hypothetical protein